MAPKLSRSNMALLIGLVALGVVLLVGLVLMRAGDDDDTGKGPFRLDLGVPTEASVAELQGVATPNRPVYWIGPPQSGRLEVTRTTGESIYVRYLPDGVDLGDGEARYTTVGTYRTPRAYATLAGSVRRGTFRSARVEGGGLAAWRSPGTSVYIARRGLDYLIEVFDPSPSRARSLATGGRVERVP